MPACWGSGSRNGKSNSRRFSARRRDIGDRVSVTLQDIPKHSRIRLFFISTVRTTLYKEAAQIPQGNWTQQGSGSLIGPRSAFQRWNKQIGRGPWESNDAAESQP